MARSCSRCSQPNSDEARFCLHCGAMLESQPQVDADPMIGRVLLNRYRVLKVLGEGGMGKVYVAEQKMGAATRKVAIKTLRPELSADPQLVARFHRESETVIQLTHPNTIQFYDFGELEDGSLFIVMEYIEGESLASVLLRGPMDPHRVDRLLIQICGSLYEAHQRGVVHRDLKPENVLLANRPGQSDFVKVLDFGIAKRSEAEDASQAKLTKQGMVLGTPPYMSPEQFSGQTLDARSDIYSLAIMAYEMLAGRLPFEANTPWEWATKHLTAAPLPLDGAQLSRIDDRKKAAIMRGLSKTREQRQGDMMQFLHEFTGIQDAQAAWAMATSTGGNAAMNVTPSAQPRMLAMTPGAVPQAPQNAWGATPAQGWNGGNDSGEIPKSGMRAGSIAAILIVLVFMIGGGAAGGWYYFSRAQQTVVANPTPKPLDDFPVPQKTEPEAIQKPAATKEESPPQIHTVPSAQEDHVPSQQTPTKTEEMPSENASSEAARPFLARGRQDISRGDLTSAVQSLKGAERVVGKRNSSLASFRREVAKRGSNQVGILMQQGRCADAQMLFRELRTVGAEGASKQHFSPDWCRQP